LEAARAKHAFEASLPPIDDLARLPQRQALIEQWEVAEWAARAEEIRGIQEERMALLEAALQVHQFGPRRVNSRRVNSWCMALHRHDAAEGCLPVGKVGTAPPC
jgi:hypothetical protein